MEDTTPAARPPLSRKRLSPPFQVEEELLAPEAAAVAAEGTALVDDAVARHHHRDAVVAVGLADRPHGRRLAQRPRDVVVRARLAVRDFLQLGPDGALEQ